MIKRLLTWLRKLWPRRIRKTPPRKLGWRTQTGDSPSTNRSKAKNAARKRAKKAKRRNRPPKHGGGWQP